MRQGSREAISRRQLLKLAAVSLLVATGCTSFRGGAELDASHEELGRLLEDFSDNYGRQLRLASVAPYRLRALGETLNNRGYQVLGLRIPLSYTQREMSPQQVESRLHIR